MSTDPLDTDKTLIREEKAGNFTLKAGQKLGQYKILRQLGRGGMGEVYEVEHETLGLRYALKLLPNDFAGQPGALERFRREARVMAQLQHPNILKVDDFGETEGRYWLRMELAKGEGSEFRGQGSGGQKKPIISLQDLAEARGGRIPQEELVGILKQILEGLAYAHGHGAIHRDLKPSNILFSAGMVKIADFGLVRLVGEEWIRSQAQLSVQRSMSMGDLKTLQKEGEGTSTRSMLGTYEYMSPEQKRGEEATAQSDLYAVGLMAFKLLTGQNPGLKPPSRIVKGLAEGWDGYLEKALEERMQDRWSDAKAILGGLEGIGLEIRRRKFMRKEEAQQAEEAKRQEVAKKVREESERRPEEARARQEIEAATRAKKQGEKDRAACWQDDEIWPQAAGGGIWRWMAGITFIVGVAITGIYAIRSSDQHEENRSVNIFKADNALVVSESMLSHVNNPILPKSELVATRKPEISTDSKSEARQDNPAVIATVYALPSATKSRDTTAVDVMSSSPISREPYLGAIVVDANNGNVLFEDGADRTGFPASMIKLMNFFVILDCVKKGSVGLADPVQVTKEAVSIGGSQVYLETQERFTVDELLYAMMIQSANDAAIALALHVAVTYERFVRMMNDKAKELGLSPNTQFMSPHGLPPVKGQPDMTTPRDFARLCSALLHAHPEVLKYTSLPFKVFRPEPKLFEMRTHNHLLGNVTGCDGLKTGFFTNAGYSIAATAQRDGARVIVIIMGSIDSKVRDAKAVELINRYLPAAIRNPLSNS